MYIQLIIQACCAGLGRPFVAHVGNSGAMGAMSEKLVIHGKHFFLH